MSAPTDAVAALTHIRAAPRDEGRLVMIVTRPAEGERRVLDVGRLDPVVGLDGDTWLERGSTTTSDGSADSLRQLTLISERLLAAIEPDRARWPLAGDQLVVDLDLSIDNLPVGTVLSVGDAVLEVTAPVHSGCASFSGRFGIDALAWVSTPDGRANRLRGMHARVLTGGPIAVGDAVRREDASPSER